MEYPIPNNGRHYPTGIQDNDSPSYFVEHLATFAVGRQYGLQSPSDGVRKLKQLEKTSAIWAQPLILRLRPNFISVEDENGDVVEQFPMDLVTNPSAYLSSDPREVHNNILLFIVKEDNRQSRSVQPTEMHIFQCNRVSAQDVVEDIKAFIMGQSQHVRGGRRNTEFTMNQIPSYQYKYSQPSVMDRGYRPDRLDDASASSDSSDIFEREVNTLNRCFDDIERFVLRIQATAMAQKEIDQQAQRYLTAQKGKRGSGALRPPESGILQMRAQPPTEPEFVDIFQKFKLSFNLLAKLKNHIHEPNAPELLHCLFAPLRIILEAGQWSLNKNIAPKVLSPLISYEARELMQNCLSSKESDVWMSLGEAWRIPPEDWQGPLPKQYHPIFIDGFAPYGPPEMHEPLMPPQPYNSRYLQAPPQPIPQPIHRGMSAPPPQTNSYHHQPPIRDHSVDNLNVELDRLNLEKEKFEFEKKLVDRERRLLDEERRLEFEKKRWAAERELMAREAGQSTMPNIYNPRVNDSRQEPSAAGWHRPQYPPNLNSDSELPVSGRLNYLEQSPRQIAFMNDVRARRAKLVQATFDRVAQNEKELTISKGEYLEVLDDRKNWWRCTNMHHRTGYVPRTILDVINYDEQPSPAPHSQQQPPMYAHERSSGAVAPSNPNGHMIPPPTGMMSEDAPDYIKQRQGKRGEFRYF